MVNGCAVYSPVRRERLKKMFPVQNAEVRYATEAFSISPADRLCCEEVMTSLHLRNLSTGAVNETYGNDNESVKIIILQLHRAIIIHNRLKYLLELRY